MTVTGSSTTFCSTAAFCASSIRVRRGSPNCLASASISLMIRRFMVDGLSRMSCSVPFSLRSSASSCWILIVSRRASWRRRISRMSSAWRSDRRNSAISAGLRLVRIADDVDHLVDVQQDRFAAFQDVDAVIDLAQLEFGTAAHRDEAEVDPLLQDVGQALLARAAVAADHHQVDRVGRLQRRMRQQHQHELGLVLVLRLRLEHQAHRRVAARFVADRVERTEDQLLERQLLRRQRLLAHLDLRIGQLLDLLEHLLRRACPAAVR